MADIDAEMLADQAVLIGILSRDQLQEAREEAEDGSVESLTRVLTRKGFLTSWQIERLCKGDPTGFIFGDSVVLFHIAEGTFARVYRGRRTHGGQPVAIKVLRRRFSADQEAVQRFIQEAEAGMKLIHPNIVKIYDFGEQDRNYYMTMEYVEGMNLREFLKLRHRLPPEQALPMMIGLAEGLSYAISHTVTHRDIKATNILISNRGEAKLVDFGLATVGGDERKMEIAHGQRTVDYSALERTCGSAKGDPRSDVYFLGCVFYQMLTGQPPLPEVETDDMLAKMLKRSFGAIKPLGEHAHAPPEGLSAIVEKMMQVELRKRFQTMDEVVTELKAYQDSLAAGTSRTHGRQQTAEEELDSLLEHAFEVPAVVPKNILCVEAQEPIQEAFRKAFSSMGYRVLLVRDAERAAERFREIPPDVVVFDADGLGPDALRSFLDMHEKAHEDGNALSAVVLLGPKQHILRTKLPSDHRVIVLTKPIKLRDVQDALTQLAPAG